MGTRFSFTATGTANAQGVCKLAFDAPPSGMVYTGTIVPYDSPNATVWTVAVAGATVGNTLGTSPAAGIQTYASEQVTLTASNLIAGTDYHATFIGQADLESSAPPPGFAGGSPQAVTAGAARLAGQQTGLVINRPATFNAYASFDVQLQPNERCIVVAIAETVLTQGGNVLSLTVEGKTTGTLWYTGTVTALKYAQTSLLSFFAYPPTAAPAYGLIDPVVTVQIGVAAGAANAQSNLSVDVLALPDPEIDGSPGNPVIVAWTTDQSVKIDAGGTAGTAGNPLHTTTATATSEKQVTVTVGAASTQVLAPPGAGVTRIIDSVATNNPSPATLDIAVVNPAVTGQGVRVATGSTTGTVNGLEWGIQSTDPGLYAIGNIPGTAVTVFYHDQ